MFRFQKRIRFQRSARSAMLHAQRLAVYKCQSAELEPEHLLLGLLLDFNFKNEVMHMLECRKVNIQEVVNTVRRRMSRQQTCPDRNRVPLSLKTLEIYREIRSNALFGGTMTITCSDILIAIVRHKRNIAAQTLLEFKLTSKNIKDIFRETSYAAYHS